jgi:gamma-glutamylputrescine oxidase
MNLSYWERRSFFENADTVVVGAGLVGLSTAIYLRRRHPTMRVLVIERDPICGGASSKNAGFACFGSLGELKDNMQSMSKEKVLALAARRYAGLRNLRDLIGDDKLEFDPSGGYELFDENERDWFEACAEDLTSMNHDLMDAIGTAPYSHMDDLPSRFPFRGFSGCIKNGLEGSINPGSMMVALLQLAFQEGVNVIHGLEVDSWNAYGNSVDLRIKDFDFKVSRLIFCTNGFARELLPDLDVRPARNQVVVTSQIPDLDWSGTFHIHRGYGYFRRIDNRILIGGFRHLEMETEFTAQHGYSAKIQDAIELTLRENIIPGVPFTLDYRWSGTMGLGPDKEILVRQVEPGVYCGVRLGGMGIAIGSLVGKELAEIIE